MRSRGAIILALLLLALGRLHAAAPTINAIADQTTNEDTFIDVSYTFTGTGTLTTSGTSSNTALVPDSSVVVIDDTGSSRTVRLTPAANASGTTVITMTISDGTLSSTRTFNLTVTAVNDPPTISAIADKVIAEGGNTGDLAVIVGDVETAPASLTLSAGSSDTTLVPLSGITFGGSGASRTVRVTPAAGQSGFATVTVTVSDGTGTTSTTFTVTVTPVNDPPTIASIAPQSTNEDTAHGPVTVTVGDPDTVVAALTLSATSSNTALFPAGSITFTGVTASRSMTLTPAADLSGTSTITVTVSDGQLTASTSFVATVIAVDDAPTIANVTNKSTNEDTATGSIAVTINDIDSPITSLILSGTSSDQTLVPDAGIVCSGNSGNRTVVITPAANQTGTATITLTVSDGSQSSSDTFTLTVSPVNDAPTIGAIAGQATSEDVAVTGIAITVGDIDTSVGSLTLSATSSDTTVFPSGSSYSFGGSGASRTLALTPAANQSGTATITITVSDGSLTASTTFTATVSPVNDAPTITAIGNQTVNEDTATGALGFTIADIDSPLASLTVTASSDNTALVPLSGIAISPSGGSRTVTLTPLPDQNGVANITVTVSDGALTGQRTFALTVTPVNDRPQIAGFVNDVTHFLDSGYEPLVSLADTGLDITDVDATTFSGGRVVAHLTTNFAGAEDELTIRTVPAVNIFKSAGNVVLWRDSVTSVDTPIGDWSYNSGTGTLTVNLYAAATRARVLDLLRAIHYTNNYGAGATSLLDRGVTLEIFEGVTDSTTLPLASKAIRIRPQNKTPTINLGSGTDAFSVGDGQQKVIAPANISIIDESTPPNLVFNLVSLPRFGTLRKGTLASSVPILSSSQTFTYQDILDGTIIYRHDGTLVASDSFQFFVSDGERATATTTFAIGIGTDRGQAVISDPIVVLPQEAAGVQDVAVIIIKPIAVDQEFVVFDGATLLGALTPAGTLDGKPVYTFQVSRDVLGYQTRRVVIRDAASHAETDIQQSIIIRIAPSGEFPSG